MDELPNPSACATAGPMPVLGLGTFKNTDPEQCAQSVATALEMGYRHIDTAQMYDNETAVGNGIERSTVDREEVFLATKVAPTNLGYEDVLASTRESVRRLGVETIDLLYVHWPTRAYDASETMAAFAELYDDGVIDHVGVSNFEPAQLETALDVCDAPIFANQIEVHPLLPQAELREVCADHGVEVVAYCPIARGEVTDQPTIQTVADNYDVTPFQVSLAWVRQKGLTAIPKATSAQHISENWASLDLALTPEDIELIDSITESHRLVDPDVGPWNNPV